MSRKNSSANTSDKKPKAISEKMRKRIEACAAFGMILIAASLAAPFAAGFDDIPGMFRYISAFKWVYAAGALIFTGARAVATTDRTESLRVRRLRRMEFWGGIAFCMAAFFWFYNCERFNIGGNVIVMQGPLAVLRDSILFSLVGAFLELVASWMIVWRKKKESKSVDSAKSSDKEK